MSKSSFTTCANPYCKKKFPSRRKKYTVSGKQIYCSKKCSSTFTIGMLRAMEAMGVSDPEEFKDEIISLSKVCSSKTELAKALGIDFKTLSSWASKLNLKWESRGYTRK